MRWGRGRSLTYYCHDVTCPGAGGFEVYEHPATETDPPYLATDYCPACRGDMHNEPIQWENAMEALADELEQAGVLEENEAQEVDWRHVFKAVHAELERQRAVRYRVEREAKRAAKEAAVPQSVIDAEFPPAELLPF